MILLAALALAQAAQPAPAATFGLGDTNCEVALRPRNAHRTFDYVMGFWSGMNVASNKGVGHTTDAHGILREVVLGCAAEPRLSIMLVTLAVHMRMERENR